MRHFSTLFLLAAWLAFVPLLVEPALATESPTPASSAEEGSKTTAPVEVKTPQPANYTLRAGDTLSIAVWKEEELTREVLILPDGTVNFPLIGTFTAAGLTPAEVKETVTKKLKPFVPAATVTVVVKQTAGNAISVVGQVARPGDIIMNRPLTVMQALSQAGGLTQYADEDSIVILRKVDGKEISLEYDYSDVARGHHLESNIILLPADVVVVPTASLF